MMNAKYREGKSCEKPSYRETRIDDLAVVRCPGNFADLNNVYLIESYSMYEKGVLPYTGTYMEQPNKIIDAFRVIGNYKTAKLVEEHKKQARASQQVKRGR